MRVGHDFGSLGKLSLTADMTWQLKDESQLLPTSPVLNENGFVGTPKWVGDFRANWSHPSGFSLFYGMNVIVNDSTHITQLVLVLAVMALSQFVDSLTSLYGAALFAERECHEMYGIRFRGNHDLRPILLYEGFEGHPLRKDYPKRREQPLVPYRDA